jgi:hypothetical protein
VTSEQFPQMIRHLGMLDNCCITESHTLTTHDSLARRPFTKSEYHISVCVRLFGCERHRDQVHAGKEPECSACMSR